MCNRRPRVSPPVDRSFRSQHDYDQVASALHNASMHHTTAHPALDPDTSGSEYVVPRVFLRS